MSQTLSVLVPYRRRLANLRTFVSWIFDSNWTSVPTASLEVVVVECDQEPTEAELLAKQANAKYLFLESTGPFHKTRALNFGLARASGTFIAAFDVDLIARRHVLAIHFSMTHRIRDAIVGGYRLMIDGTATIGSLTDLQEKDVRVAPEDMPTALTKQLLNRERMMITPMCSHALLNEIGGWDEGFRGWGAEDQDLIERAEAFGSFTVRSPQLLYFHLNHPPDPEWSEKEWTVVNRTHYYAKRDQVSSAR